MFIYGAVWLHYISLASETGRSVAIASKCLFPSYYLTPIPNTIVPLDLNFFTLQVSSPIDFLHQFRFISVILPRLSFSSALLAGVRHQSKPMSTPPPSSTQPRRFGLRWKDDMWGPQPEWTCEPELSVIQTIAARYVSEPTVTFLGAGAFNKLYTITSPSRKSDLVFRVTLPVEPRYKTASEVATINYVSRRTGIPVPAVIAYDCNADNELSFEWILMEKVLGVCYKEIEESIPKEVKHEIVKKVAGYIVEMREKCRFDMIGSLYQRSDLTEEELKTTVPTELEDIVIGPAVTMFMFFGPLKSYIPRNRGPYRTDGEFLGAQLDAQIRDLQLLQTLATGQASVAQYIPAEFGDDEFDSDSAENAAEVEKGLQALRSVVPSLFLGADSPPTSTPPFVLRHQDLNHSNIMIDPATHTITGIIDWECTTSVPTWDDSYPVFIDGKDRAEQPSRPATPTSITLQEQWEDWENTQLRKIFDEVTKTRPREDIKGEVKRLLVVHMNSVGFFTKMVITWTEKLQMVLDNGWEGVEELRKDN